MDGKREVREENAANEVDKDYSEEDARVLRQGLTEGSTKQKVSLGDAEATEAGVGRPLGPPTDRIRNPFLDLYEVDPSSEVVHRSVDGTWRSKGGVNLDDAKGEKTKMEKKAALKTHHPDIALDLPQPVAMRQEGAKSNPVPDVRVKLDSPDYISKRDEMREWWLEKMKTPRQKSKPGAMLGVDSPKRDPYIDHEMMMRQYGPNHLPQTTEQWEIHNTWEHKRKYINKTPPVPRYERWGKRAVFGVCAYLVLGQYLYLYYDGHQANQSYKNAVIHDRSHLRDRFAPPWRSLSTYPFV